MGGDHSLVTCPYVMSLDKPEGTLNQDLKFDFGELYTLVCLLFFTLCSCVIFNMLGQIQTLIAQTMRRQSEALGKKRTSARVTAAAFVRRSQGNYRISRGRRNQRAGEVEGSDDEEDVNGHDEGKDSSSSDEQVTEVKPKRCKRWGGARCSQTSLAAGGANGGGDGNDSEVNRDSVGAAAGLVGSSEMLAWGGGGVRSNTRHGSLSAGNGKNARTIRVSKLLENLRNSVENDGVIVKCITGVAIANTTVKRC